jgi:hypothetical protein
MDGRAAEAGRVALVRPQHRSAQRGGPAMWRASRGGFIASARQSFRNLCVAQTSSHSHLTFSGVQQGLWRRIRRSPSHLTFSRCATAARMAFPAREVPVTRGDRDPRRAPTLTGSPCAVAP